jgi:hypothetical protein
MLFPPDRQHQVRTEITTRITAKRNLNPVRHRSYPRVVKRARHNSYPVKRKSHNGTRHTGPAVIRLANQTFIPPIPGKPQVTALQATEAYSGAGPMR